MKRPYYNLQQRLLMRLETLQGACMELNIAWLRLCRDIERSAKRSKFLLFIFNVVWRREPLKSDSKCLMCEKQKPNDGHSCCEDCGGIAF